VEKVARLAEVRTSETSGGHVRYVDGNEYTTFRGRPGADTDPQEAAWRTAVDAAPWLVGDPGEAVPPEELYEKLKPFEQRVAADIEEEQDEGPG
jgi:hypothetical protein